MRIFVIGSGGIVAGLILATSLPLLADQPAGKPAATPAKAGVVSPKKSSTQATKPARPSPASQGMTVVRDPVTGELRAPTAEEAAALNAAAPAPAPALLNLRAPAQIFLPGGGVAMRVDESSMVYSVAKIGPDGKLVYECVTGESAARKAMAAPVSVQKHSAVEVK